MCEQDGIRGRCYVLRLIMEPKAQGGMFPRDQDRELSSHWKLEGELSPWTLLCGEVGAQTFGANNPTYKVDPP